MSGSRAPRAVPPGAGEPASGRPGGRLERPVAIFRFSPHRRPGLFRRLARRAGLAVAARRARRRRAGAGRPARVRRHRPDGRSDERQRRPRRGTRRLRACCARRSTGRSRCSGHCLGGQLLAQALGAPVTRAPVAEIGWVDVAVCDVSAQRDWFGGRAAFTTFQWHYDAFALPAGATPRADQRVQRQPGVRGRRTAHRFPVPHRDDEARWSRRGLRPGRTNFPRNPRRPRRAPPTSAATSTRAWPRSMPSRTTSTRAGRRGWRARRVGDSRPGSVPAVRAPAKALERGVRHDLEPRSVDAFDVCRRPHRVAQIALEQRGDDIGRRRMRQQIIPGPGRIAARSGGRAGWRVSMPSTTTRLPSACARPTTARTTSSPLRPAPSASRTSDRS